MNKKSELDCYLYYMWNVWSYDVCDEIFGAMYGGNYARHIWNKWYSHVEKSGSAGAPASFYADVDKQVREELVECAMDYYNK